MFLSTFNYDNYASSIVLLFRDLNPLLFESIEHKLDNPQFFESLKKTFALDIQLSAGRQLMSPLASIGDGRSYPSNEEKMLSDFHVKVMELN